MNPSNDLGVRPGESDGTRMLGVVMICVLALATLCVVAVMGYAILWATPTMDCRVSARLSQVPPAVIAKRCYCCSDEGCEYKGVYYGPDMYAPTPAYR